ncbi:MAG: hypothetical protein Kow0037_09070 [Calditrichia bacterium]
MLDAKLLEILACPKCTGDLEYKVDPENDKNGSLTCHQCNLLFRVEDDIPIMLLDEAEELESDE